MNKERQWVSEWVREREREREEGREGDRLHGLNLAALNV